VLKQHKANTRELLAGCSNCIQVRFKFGR